MTTQDYERFSVELGKTATALLFKIDDPVIDEYFDVLRRFPLSRVVDGLEQARRTCRYMPRPAEVMALMGVGEERDDPAASERLALPEGRRALTAGEPAKLTADMIRHGLADLRQRCGWDESPRPHGADQDPERLAFWDRVEALRKGEHL